MDCLSVRQLQYSINTDRYVGSPVTENKVSLPGLLVKKSSWDLKVGQKSHPITFGEPNSIYKWINETAAAKTGNEVNPVT
jgi:hypothetical protein